MRVGTRAERLRDLKFMGESCGVDVRVRATGGVRCLDDVEGEGNCGLVGSELLLRFLKKLKGGDWRRGY